MFQNKNGFFHWDDPKTMANLLVGMVVLALGLIPLLNVLNVIEWGLPGFLSNVIAKIGLYIIAGLGLWLLIDGFMEAEGLQKVTLIVGLVVLALGILPLLSSFGVIPEIPFLGFVLNPIVFNVIFVIEGLLLIIAAWGTY
ncbi:MAG: hypothetical protein ACQESG_02000 [Nanobdellota archaeon]